MEKRPISDLMETTIQKVKEMVDANTIIGEPVITPDGITLLPVSKLSLGFVGGGSDSAKKPEAGNAFGGGIGAGVKIEPIAFIVVRGENVRLLHVNPQSGTTLDKIIDLVPEVIDKVSGLFDKKDSEAE